MWMIRVENLSKYYPPPIRSLFDVNSIKDILFKPREKILALYNLNFTIFDGEIFGMLGPNGAGKTTFCKIINGLLIPTKGNIYIDNFDVIREHKKKKEKILTIFGGDKSIYSPFQWRVSIYKNLLFIGRVWGIPSKDLNKRIDYSLSLLSLTHKKNEWYEKLSAGMRQKLHLALPFIIRPKILILDEPTVYLDIMTKKNIWETIKLLSHQYKMTVILTTNDLHEAELLTDRILIFNKKKIIEGKTKDIIEKFSLYSQKNLAIKTKKKISYDDIKYITNKYQVESVSEKHLELIISNDEISDLLHLLNKYVITDITSKPISLEDIFIKIVGEDNEIKYRF